jgi:hypothetical protein
MRGEHIDRTRWVVDPRVEHVAEEEGHEGTVEGQDLDFEHRIARQNQLFVNAATELWRPHRRGIEDHLVGKGARCGQGR